MSEPTAEATNPPVTPDEPLGEGGKKALQSERDARKALEAEIAQMKAEQKDQLSKLAAAFGVTDGAAKANDPVDALTKRFNDLESTLSRSQWSLRVAEVAREHGITDVDDLALLESATDEEKLTKMAARLKVNPTPDLPGPDPAQGGTQSPPLALNGDGIEQALKSKLGIR